MIGVLSVIAAVAASAVAASRRCRHALHMLQLDSYLNGRYLRWLVLKPWERIVEPWAVLGASALLLSNALPWAPDAAYVALLWPVLLALLPALRRKDDAPVKKALQMTGRAKRILWTARALIVLFSAVTAIFLATAGGGRRVAYPALIAAVIVLHSAPWTIIAANVLMGPVQAQINRRFVRSAAAKLADLKPVVIGVAGSYGKTSTKYFIETLLAERYPVLKTPGSFNTLLGVTRVINESLTAEHKILIAEMGAYKRGEVKEICDLAPPKMGIISSIGPEHYERFLTMENIEETNYELIAALPPDGLAVFNCENEHCRKLADRTRHTRVMRYSMSNANGGSDLWAEDIQLTREGLRFVIASASGGRIPAETVLAGRLNVLNILGAVCIATGMGLPPEEVARGISKLKPAPHRLEVKPGGGGTTIIDDSYNSNPLGAAEALHVLSQFTGGKRILITPGMVELGELHRQANEEFGYQASQACDFVILVGPEQTRPVADGLRRGGFPEKDLRIVKDLSAATAIFGKMLRPGDVLLFENDLPDLYSE